MLVLFAFALLCQGALAALSPECRLGRCCAPGGADVAMAAQAVMPQADLHAPCEASHEPCDDDGCQCHVPGLTALLTPPPKVPSTEPDDITASACLRQVAQHVPGGPLRPPHRLAC